MANNSGNGGPNNTQGNNPFKLAALSQPSSSLVFSSASRTSAARVSTHSTHMLFGGMTNTSPTASSSSSKCNFFGMTSTSPSSPEASISSTSLFRTGATSSLSSGPGEGLGTNTEPVQKPFGMSSAVKPTFGGTVSSTANTSGNVFGGLASTSSATQSIFGAQTKSVSSGGQFGTGNLFGNKTSTSEPASKSAFSVMTTAAASSNDFHAPTGDDKQSSVFSLHKPRVANSTNQIVNKDNKIPSTPLLFGGVTSTGHNPVSLNVFRGTSAPKLFEGMKSTAASSKDSEKTSQAIVSKASKPISTVNVFGGGPPSDGTAKSKATSVSLYDDIPEPSSEPSSQGNSPEYDKKELTKLIIAQIPDSCMDREILRNHFSKYGTVKRVTLNPKTNQATVQYEDYRGASRAKKKGKKIHPKLPEVRIFYGTPVRRKSEDGNSDAMISKKRAIRTLQTAKVPNDLEPYIPLSRPDKEAMQLPKPIQSKVTQSKRKLINDEKPAEKVKKSLPRPEAVGKKKKEPSIATDGKDPKDILNSKCNTNYDKYLVLKARDSMVRKEVIRTSDIHKATYLAATCPDMCPEKERYMRDVQNDLSSYEMKNGVIDHSLVVKKFSRSSADKDEPLPYELRPGPVLLKTMNFLVCNIIDRGEDEDVEIDVWYNYLWNRTRAIRNDLMQQQLTDGIAVNIIERCMRFHIHAAARFCQEPPDLFDAKMNTEHLTKSLQTLKELYKDLGERGEYFDTEPEFRAYELLLNLNEGETIMTQYSQYREEVQKSKEVQFALKVGMAVMFNNYVKFFHLIQSATYLQACMMHRYFRQVRSKALETLMKAYIPPKQTQNLPLETVIRTLGFEDETDAENFLQVYGIKVTEKNVILDRSLFSSHIEEPPPVVRPKKLVESNRNCSVGEVIQGGPLPENPLLTYVSHNSFDSQGFLNDDAVDAADQQTEKQREKKSQPTMVKAETLSQVIPKVTKPDLTIYAPDVFDLISKSVFKESVPELSREVIEETIHKEAPITRNEILEDYLKAEISRISQRAIQEIAYEEEEKRRRQIEEEERQRKAKRELMDKVAKLLCVDYMKEFINESVRKFCDEVVQEEKQTWEAVVSDILPELQLKLSEEVVLNEVEKISLEALSAMREELEAKITYLQEKVATRKMRDYFKKWRLHVLRVKRRKQAQETFPASSSQFSVIQQNELLGWGYQRGKQENISAFKLSLLEEAISKNIEEKTIKNHLVRECAWNQLPLQEEMKKEVDGALQPTNLIRQYFKVLICTFENTNSVITHWLRSKLSATQDCNVHQKLKSLFSFVSKNAGLEYSCLICEVSIDNLNPDDIKGTSAVIFVMPSRARKQEIRSRAYCLLKKLYNIPKLTIQYDEESSDANVESLLDSPIWKLSECDLYYPETSKKLLSHLLDFWRRQDDEIQVVSSCLNNLVYGFIASKVVETILYKNRERIEDGKSPLPPQAYISLYNEAINHLITVVEDEEIKKLEWPAPGLSHLEQIPPESWNKSDVELVSNLLRKLKLPDLQLEDFMSQAAIKRSLHEYAIKICNHEDSSIVLISHLNVLINNSLILLNSPMQTEDEDWKIHVLKLPWTELVNACISHKVTGLPDLAAFHQHKKLNSFIYPRSWWEACDCSNAQWGEIAKENNMPRKRKQGQNHDTSMSQKKRPSQLLLDIAKEKNKYLEFENKLKSILES